MIWNVTTCDECGYATITAGDLKKHIKSKHEGLRYPCDKCEYASTKLSSLTEHIKRKHEGV